jgi:glycosyltransferase involved in cell wall biosynthesis
MHIALNAWFWDRPFTGSGQVVRRLTETLARTQAGEVTLTLVLPPHITAPDGVPDGVRVVHTRGPRGSLGKVWFEQALFPRAVRQAGADLAHVPYWGAPLSSPAPLIVSVLDVIPLALPQYASGFLPRLYTSLQTAAARGAAHILTISHAAKADIETYLGLPGDSITVTHLAADEAFHPRIGAERDAAVREKYGLPDQFVLYIGGFDARKQVTQLVSAYTYVAPALGDEAPLVLAGPQPAWGAPMFPDIPAEIAEAKLGDLVRFIGPVDESDKPSLMRLADIFVFPSGYEGFGLPVLEAMASGTPVVANDIPVIAEIAGDAAYLVEAGSSRKMAAAIIALHVDKTLRETQVTRALGQATSFSWRKTARETLAVYRQVLSQAGR